MIGQFISHYRVTSKLGAGGMGEVYRATDPRLGRDVAIKVLPQAFAQDAERMARFQREAQVLASLNHPNIAAIYGLEESGGMRALVMELVEGPTLAERIRQGALPLEEALPIAKQISEALEAAHERGIVHRDLKPANVKITPGGKVKVLDFGLAKALAPDSGMQDISHSPTLSVMGATREGLILGTAAYMSPEQARGKALDKRTDIWAFGCVLYECLTGHMAFRGDTVSDTVAAILTREPDLQSLPAGTPRRIRELLRRCLQKDANQRLHDIADARLEIEEAIAHPGAEISEAAGGAFAPSRWKALAPWGVAAILLLVLALQIWRPFFSTGSSAQPAVRVTLNLPPKTLLAISDWPLFTFSPDGTRLIFVGREAGGPQQLYLRRLDQYEATPIRGTENSDKPFLSPDGQWVVFTADKKMKKVSLEGGPSVALCDVDWGGGTWGPDDQIIFTREYNSGLWKVPATGGTPQMLTSPDRTKNELGHWWPQILPDGEHVLYTAFSTPIEKSRIMVRSLRTGEERTLFDNGTYARYVPSGHLLFARTETVFAVPFDARKLEITGAAVPVLDGVANFPQNGFSQYAVSANGTLAYLRSSAAQTARTLVSVDRRGKIQTVREDLHTLGGISLSPDGKRIALGLREGGRAPDVWILSLDRGALTRLTFGPASNFDPQWTLDGKRVVYISERPVFDLYAKAADGTGSEEAVLTSANDKYPLSFTPDGKALLLSVSDPKNSADLWILTLDGKKEMKPFLASPFAESGGAFSPDGRWIAYQSDESGKPEIYLQSYSTGGSRAQVSTDGGKEPLWSKNGKELFYRAGNKLMSVAINAGTPGKPQVVFEGEFLPGDRAPSYAVSPDGQRFYLLQSNQQATAQASVDLILNWFDELKRRVPAGRK